MTSALGYSILPWNFKIKIIRMILYRYIFNQLGSMALATVGLFTFLLLTGNVLKDVLKLWAAGRLDFILFMELLALLIPYVVAYALPIGLLSAVLIVFGRLSANREIVAMKAAGMSLFQISKPLWLLAGLSIIFSLGINLYYGPKARGEFKERLANAFVANPTNFIAKGQFILDFPGYILYIKDENDKVLQNLSIWELDSTHKVKKTITAQEAFIEENLEEGLLILKLLSGYSQIPHASAPLGGSPTSRHLSFDEATLKLPMGDFLKPSFFQKKRAQMTLSELFNQRSEARAKSLQGDAQAYQDCISIQMQIQKNIAMAFAIIALILIALPLGIQVSRVETYANCAIAFGLAILYYMSIVICTGLEQFPCLRPDLLIWLPNLLFGGVGSFLLYKHCR